MTSIFQLIKLLQKVKNLGKSKPAPNGDKKLEAFDFSKMLTERIDHYINIYH